MSPHPLFKLDLMGKGTAEVESLPSYLHRCAIAHSCDVGQLMTIADQLVDGSGLCLKESGKPRYTKPHELVRSGKLADLFIHSLGWATGEQLDSSVIWVLRTTLGVSANEVVKGFRWCPECFADNEKLGIPAYFKLIWHMSSVTACHIHRTPLVQQCEFCGCNQIHYKKTRELGFCQECGVSLSKRREEIDRCDLASSWEDIGNDIVELFGDLASVKPGSLPEDGPYKSINDLFDYYWKINREDVFYETLTRDEMIALAYKQKKVSMLTARRVAFRLGIPLYAFLAGEAASISGVLNHGMLCTLPDGYLDVNHKAPKNHIAILKEVTEIISDSEVPLTAKAVCKRAGISTGYMAHRYPALYSSIVDKRKDYNQEQRLKKRYRAQAAALEYFVGDEYSASTKSRNHAYKTLREKTGLPKWELERAIEAAYRALS
ncbi:TniQ family protein [Bacterioplanoides pacificum]|uniref:TniQ family protein n=1 Tax=Bacterioplanoides pacificum TaxID=1171596 RepID=A0ABV7VSP2_9GAMM